MTKKIVASKLKIIYKKSHLHSEELFQLVEETRSGSQVLH